MRLMRPLYEKSVPFSTSEGLAGRISATNQINQDIVRLSVPAVPPAVSGSSIWNANTV